MGGLLCKASLLMFRDHPSLHPRGRRRLIKCHRVLAKVSHCSFRANVGNPATCGKKQHSTKQIIDEQLSKHFPVERFDGPDEVNVTVGGVFEYRKVVARAGQLLSELRHKGVYHTTVVCSSKHVVLPLRQRKRYMKGHNTQTKTVFGSNELENNVTPHSGTRRYRSNSLHMKPSGGDQSRSSVKFNTTLFFQ